MLQKVKAVLAMLLIVTMLVPSYEKAEAASSMKMDKTAKTLYLNEDNMTDTSDTYNFSIKYKPVNYKTKYTFKWSTPNTDIIEVGKGGLVKARKVGQGVVKCDIFKKNTGKIVTTLRAIVTVKANAETVKIKNAPENNTLKVGDSFDFNRSMLSKNGRDATDKTEWVSSDPNILEINSTGVAEARKPGKVTIQCKCYQSAATKELGYTAESELLEITVLNDIKEINVVSLNKVNITFAADLSKELKNTGILITNAKTSMKNFVKTVTYDEKTCTAQIELYNNFAEYTTYSVKIDDMTKSFDVNDFTPAKIQLENPSGEVGEVRKLDIKVFNSNGVDVTSPELLNRIQVTSPDSSLVFYRDSANMYVNIPSSIEIGEYSININLYDNNSLEKIIATTNTSYLVKKATIVSAIPYEPTYRIVTMLLDNEQIEGFSVTGQAIVPVDEYSSFWLEPVKDYIDSNNPNIEIVMISQEIINDVLTTCYRFQIFKDNIDITEEQDEFTVDINNSQLEVFDSKSILVDSIYVKVYRGENILYEGSVDINALLRQEFDVPQ